jgi:hypothetical protein
MDDIVSKLVLIKKNWRCQNGKNRSVNLKTENTMIKGKSTKWQTIIHWATKHYTQLKIERHEPH